MASGLKVWDTSGNLILDVTDRLGRLIGSVVTTSAAGSINDPALSYGIPFFMIAIEPGQTEGYYLENGVVKTRWRPSVTFSGNTMSWTAGVPSRITYGVW